MTLQLLIEAPSNTLPMTNTHRTICIIFLVGRFCSQRCVGAYASKKRAEMIQQQVENGERAVHKTTKKPWKPVKAGRKRKSEVPKVRFLYLFFIKHFKIFRFWDFLM